MNVNLPNLLTMSRFLFAIAIVMFLLLNTAFGYVAALVSFALASVSDFYDGYLAKTRGLVSDFGKIMDPIADKVLTLSVFGTLAHLGLLPWWMFIVIAVREVAVTVSRLLAMAKGHVLAAEKLGKIKTVLQMGSITLILLFLVFLQYPFFRDFYTAQGIWLIVIEWMLRATVFITVLSGITYFMGQWRRK